MFIHSFMTLVLQDMDSYFWRAVAVEGIAMSCFLFNVVITVCTNTDVQLNRLDSDKQLLIALVFGLNIFLLVYFTAGLSGGNLNPAVTLSLMIGKRISVVRGIFYIASQCVGAIIGTGMAKVVSGAENFDRSHGAANIISPGYDAGQVMLGEIVCTGMLCLAVQVGLSGELWQLMEKTRMDMLLPVAVGTAVVIGHMVLIPLDGCSINPARSFGSAVVSGEWADQWVFWVGPFVGGTVSILLWELLLRPPQEVSRADYNMRRASTLIAEGQRPAARLSRQVGRFVAPTF
eukprot:TRINITY_DN1298_c0_g1_i2.p1 TRINITY_DN1298_c0_g1~~TRINITY_DN1298_c0_g1_i2.p1  ORF type:complete len:289 (-),score=107.01 TRINITY_DN1298_c0_g1_i2:312-1178(-)